MSPFMLICAYMRDYPSQRRDRLQSSESDICRCHILMTKVNPHTLRVKIFIMAVDNSIGIQMNRKELTKTFMMISN